MWRGVGRSSACYSVGTRVICKGLGEYEGDLLRPRSELKKKGGASWRACRDRFHDQKHLTRKGRRYFEKRKRSDEVGERAMGKKKGEPALV